MLNGLHLLVVIANSGRGESSVAFAGCVLEEEPVGVTLSERVRVLFQRLRLPLFRYLLRNTRNAGTAEDLAQETFFRVCRHLETNGHSITRRLGR